MKGSGDQDTGSIVPSLRSFAIGKLDLMKGSGDQDTGSIVPSLRSFAIEKLDLMKGSGGQNAGSIVPSLNSFAIEKIRSGKGSDIEIRRRFQYLSPALFAQSGVQLGLVSTTGEVLQSTNHTSLEKHNSRLLVFAPVFSTTIK